MQRYGNVSKLASTNRRISYTRSRELFLEYVKKSGLAKGNFGLHSFKSGGATAAANNGTSDRLFKRHGRWRSETAKDTYVVDDIIIS